MIRISRFACLAVATLATACMTRDDPAPVVQHGATPVTQVAAFQASDDGRAAILVRPGDTLSKIARREGIPVRALMDANGLAPPYLLKVGQVLRAPEQTVYTVERGETFASIAVRLKQEAWALAQANGLKPPYDVRPGQKLVVPGAASAPAIVVAAATTSHAAQVRSPKPASKALAVRAEPVRPPQDEPVSTLTVPSAPRGTVEAAPLEAPVPALAPTKADVLAVQPAVAAAETKPSLVAARGGKQFSSAPVRAEAEEEAKPRGASRGRLLTSEPSTHVVPAVARAPRLSDEPPPRSGRHFAWPVKGKLISSYGPQPGGLHNDGLNIAASPGAQVTAAENGVVAYAGSDLKGFGNLLLVKHAGGFVTAYAHNDKLLVKRGDTVKRGQAIATVGESGAVTRPQVHFQVRQGAHAVDPRPLMERSS